MVSQSYLRLKYTEKLNFTTFQGVKNQHDMNRGY